MIASSLWLEHEAHTRSRLPPSNPAGHGRIGVTFCPGKYDPHALTGSWDRDLTLDLDAVKKWGAAAVVTLVEDHELELLRVPNLGKEVRRRGMSWFHLPIPDGSVPDADFERAWKSVGDELRSMLKKGDDVVVHCRGGLGRAGTVAEGAPQRLRLKRGVAMAIAAFCLSSPSICKSP